MKNIKPAVTASFLLLCALVLSFYAVGLSPKGVSAESNAASGSGKAKRSNSEKISQTLRERAARGDEETVQIILQLNARPTGRLNALLQRIGVRV
jgi:hypothetical protein